MTEQHWEPQPDLVIGTSNPLPPPGSMEEHRFRYSMPEGYRNSFSFRAEPELIEAMGFRPARAVRLVDVDAVTAALRGFADAIEYVLKGIRDLDLLPEEPPEEPRARALWMRQHRNTGPKPPPIHRR